ncbi:MAG: class I SAM-dependent methyltransferase [Rhodocyclaceae bacterium]|nr:class I SAM-dependent methyltransferase [Rhodocyclaceae bacterium]
MTTLSTLAPVASILLTVCLFVLVAINLHKTRRIHLATFKLLDDLAKTRKETESLFAQFQALMALERKLDMKEALPPLRGWVGSPDFLLVVANHILSEKPQAIMECSSGVSTLVTARCLQINGSGHCYSLEHEPAYAAQTRKLLAKYQLSEWATVLDAPLTTQNTETPWYDETAIPPQASSIELLIVDGPPSHVAPLARQPAYDRLSQRLANNATIILDDADRPDETKIVKRWQQDEPTLLASKVNCEKGCVILNRQR